MYAMRVVASIKCSSMKCSSDNAS